MIARFGRWWTHDLPPLDGRLRFAIYALLLGLGYRTFVERIPSALSRCPPELYEPAGLMQIVAGAGLGLPELGAWLPAARWLLVVCWVCSALGLLGRAPMLLTGLGTLGFWGAYKGCTPTGHTWHLPALTLLWFGLFAAPDARWSLDAVLARRFRGYPFRPERRGTLAASGFARKLVLVCSSYILFAAGVSKLREAGLAWADGQSLQHYLLYYTGERKAGFGWLFDALVAHPWAAVAASLGTLLIELGAPAAIFLPRLRIPLLLAASLLHAGIAAVMIPRYFPQSVCYLAAADWSGLGRAWRSRRGGRQDPARDPPAGATLAVWRSGLAAALGCGLAGVLLVGLWRGLEWYPLTTIPMYSSYFSEGVIAGYPAEYLESREGLVEVSRRYLRTQQPWILKFHLPRLVRFVLVSDASPQTRVVRYEDLRRAGLDWVLALRVTEHVTRHLAADAQPAGGLDAATPAAELLRKLKPYIAKLPEARGYDGLELQLELRDGPWLLARTAL